MADELPTINRNRPTVTLLQKALAQGLAAPLSAVGKAVAAQIVAALGITKASATGGRRAIAKIYARDDITKAKAKPGGDEAAIAEAAVRARKALAALDLEDEWKAVVSVAETALQAAAFDGVLAGMQQLGLADAKIITVAGDQTVGWAKGRAAELVGMKRDKAGKLIPNPNAKWRIDDTTREMIRGTVEKALTEGWSAAETSKAIQDSSAFSASRADNIARTEIARADMHGTMIGYRASGVVIGKRWSTSQDDQVSEECVSCEKVGGIELDADFPTGVDAPPNHPRCRCSVSPVLDGEKLGKALALAMIGAIHKRAMVQAIRRR